MSSKTQKKQDDATESAPKARNPLGLWLGVGLLLFGSLAVISGIRGLTDNRQRLFAPEGAITVEVVDNPETRQQGLSGRESIGDDEGMLFVFDDVSEHCFWMKDMNFSLDMIWLNEDKEIINIHRDVSPESYLTEERYCAEEPAKYGLEINSGRAIDLGIEQGEQLRF